MQILCKSIEFWRNIYSHSPEFAEKMKKNLESIKNNSNFAAKYF